MRAAAVILACLFAGPAAAQAPPALEVEAPPALAPARARVAGYDTRTLADITRVVGLATPGPPIRVVLAEEDGPWSDAVPEWTAGYAIGEAGLVVLFPSRSPRYPHDTLEDVLRHEVAHVLIARAARGQPVPRWFHEGLAVAVERPWGFEDRTRLASELLFGPRRTLAQIDALFGGDQGEQTRGYLLAAAVVRDLIAQHGPGAPARILRDRASGARFELALAGATGALTPAFEAAFWDRQRTWTTWVPLLASTSVLWLAVIGIGVLAVRRRKRRAAEIRRRWAAEDAARAPDRDDQLTPSA